MKIICSFYDANIEITTIKADNLIISQKYGNESTHIDASGEVGFYAEPADQSEFVRWVYSTNGETWYSDDNPFTYTGEHDINIRAEGVTVMEESDKIHWVPFEWDIPKDNNSRIHVSSEEWNRFQLYVERMLTQKLGSNHGYSPIMTSPKSPFTAQSYNNVRNAIKMVEGYGDNIPYVETKKAYAGIIFNIIADELNKIILTL